MSRSVEDLLRRGRIPVADHGSHLRELVSTSKDSTPRGPPLARRSTFRRGRYLAADAGRHGTPRITALDAVVFVDELVLLAVLGISGASIDAPAIVRVVLAVGFVAVAGVVWGRWLAPRAARPLAPPQRLGAKLAVFAVAAIAFAATDHVVGAMAFFAVSAVLVIASERQRHRLGP